MTSLHLQKCLAKTGMLPVTLENGILMAQVNPSGHRNENSDSPITGICSTGVIGKKWRTRPRDRVSLQETRKENPLTIWTAPMKRASPLIS